MQAAIDPRPPKSPAVRCARSSTPELARVNGPHYTQRSTANRLEEHAPAMIRKTETLPTWDLTDLYTGTDDPRLQEDMDAVRQQARDFEQRFKGTIGISWTPQGKRKAGDYH